MELKEIKRFLNKSVILTKKISNAKYKGTVSWISESKGMLILDRLIILNRDESFKVASKSCTKRGFKIEDIKHLWLG